MELAVEVALNLFRLFLPCYRTSGRQTKDGMDDSHRFEQIVPGGCYDEEDTDSEVLKDLKEQPKVPDNSDGEPEPDRVSIQDNDSGGRRTPDSGEQIEEEEDEMEIFERLRNGSYHIFVLSESGKPIFSSCGKEEKLCSLFGLIQVFISRVESWEDSLQTISSKNLWIQFMHKSPLIYCLISRHPYQLITQLNTVHQQILSILCKNQLQTVYQKRGYSFDLRRLLGADRHLDGAIRAWRADPSVLLQSVRILPMPQADRDFIAGTIAQAVNTAKINSIYFGLFLANRQLIALVRRKKCILHPSDVNIITNLITYNNFKTAEFWTPICLPHFSDTGFLHAHISYLWEGTDACLVLLSDDRFAFEQLSGIKQQILHKLNVWKNFAALETALSVQYCVDLDSLGEKKCELWHFVYKNLTSSQVCTAQFKVPYLNEAERKQLLLNYTKMVHFMRQPSAVKFVFVAQAENVLLVLITTNFELYCTFSPFVQRASAINIVDRLIKALKKDEGKFFISSTPTF